MQEAQPSQEEQIVSFSDENAGMMTAVDSAYEPTMDTAYAGNSDIGSYLGRPVEIDTSSWVVGQPLFKKINPWTKWATNKWVAQKLSNYELLRCKLHIKIVINGTQFHYGKALVGYNPMRGPFDEVVQTRNFLDQDLVQLSQKPHVFLDPSDGEGAEMLLPYFWYDNYFSLTKKDMQYAGDLYYKSFGNLLTASTGTDPVTITTYAWAEDVVLTMPTSLNEYNPQSGEEIEVVVIEEDEKEEQVNDSIRDTKPYKCMLRIMPLIQMVALLGTIVAKFSADCSADDCPYEPQMGKKKAQGKPKKKAPAAMNSGDEYGKGVISQPAQAVAKAAGMLEMIPFIAPYARATEMVATKVGQIASLFGYARPNILTDIEAYRPKLAGNLTNVNAADTSQKLSLDSKQEVSIDSRVAGLTGEDEMTMNSIVTRESYVTSFSLSESDAAGKILWNTYINPAMAAYLQDEIHMTPMAFWSQQFNYWQGSIKLRFQVVKSKFHKGRILLRWDPRSHSADIDTNAVYSRVVDISEEEDFEITIGWGQANPFLECVTCTSANQLYDTTRLTTDNSNLHNGVLELNVINQLVSPDGDSPVRINVFASMCDDAKFGQPAAERLVNLSPFTPQTGFEPQSGEGEDMGDMDTKTGVTSTLSLDPIVGEAPAADQTYNVFFGETITSLRELIKRYQVTRVIVKPQVDANNITISTLQQKAQPYVAGWDTLDGLDYDANDTTKCTIGVNGPLSLWNLCYAGWRGGLRHKFVASSVLEGSYRVHRHEHNNAYGFTQVSENAPGFDGDITKFLSARTAEEGWDGMELNHASYNKVLEVEIPFYTGKRYLPARQIHANSILGDTIELSETYVSGGNAPKRVYIEDYVAAADDYSLMFFTGIPVMYRYFLNESSAATP